VGEVQAKERVGSLEEIILARHFTHMRLMHVIPASRRAIKSGSVELGIPAYALTYAPRLKWSSESITSGSNIVIP